MKAIRVRDANGDELTLFEFRPSTSYRKLLTLNRNGTNRLALDTGEAVERVDDHNFVIVATGEQLTRIP